MIASTHMPKPTRKRSVTRSVVFDQDVLKHSLAESKKEGRSFSNWVNRAVSKSIKTTSR